MTFNKWLDTLIAEKNLDPETIFDVKGPSGLPNIMPLSTVIDAMKRTTTREQAAIKAMLVKIDFANGKILPYFAHLAKAIAI